MRWAYGITTVPSRSKDLLPLTIESLRKGGFDKPRLFIDGATPAEVADYRTAYPRFDLTVREPKILAVGNWILAAWELFIRSPEADRYAIFQDDFVTYPNLRRFLEQSPYPKNGYLNLYTTGANQSRAPRNGSAQQLVGWFESNQGGKGALATVFDREAMRALLSHEHFLRKVSGEPRRRYRSIDGAIVEAMKGAGFREYVHNPSLVQHTGILTTIDKRKDSFGDADVIPVWRWPSDHLAPRFKGETFDALRLLEMRGKPG